MKETFCRPEDFEWLMQIRIYIPGTWHMSLIDVHEF